MADKPTIVIPSRGRSDRVTTTAVINNAVLVVAESQRDDYHRHNPGVEIVTHPDELEVPGPYTRKLQWILDTFGDVFYLDDDVIEFRCLAIAAGEDCRRSADIATAVVYATHDAAKQAGAFYWGFNTQNDPRMYSGLQPIRLTGMCWGNGCGIRADDPGCQLFWSPDIKTHEDYYMALLNAYHHRYAYFDDRWKFVTDGTFAAKGGASLYRTTSLEKEAAQKLVELFGDSVQLKQDTTRAKRKHQWQITLKVPWMKGPR